MNSFLRVGLLFFSFSLSTGYADFLKESVREAWESKKASIPKEVREKLLKDPLLLTLASRSILRNAEHTGLTLGDLYQMKFKHPTLIKYADLEQMLKKGGDAAFLVTSLVSNNSPFRKEDERFVLKNKLHVGKKSPLRDKIQNRLRFFSAEHPEVLEDARKLLKDSPTMETRNYVYGMLLSKFSPSEKDVELLIKDFNAIPKNKANSKLRKNLMEWFQRAAFAFAPTSGISGSLSKLLEANLNEGNSGAFAPLLNLEPEKSLKWLKKNVNLSLLKKLQSEINPVLDSPNVKKVLREFFENNPDKVREWLVSNYGNESVLQGLFPSKKRAALLQDLLKTASKEDQEKLLIPLLKTKDKEAAKAAQNIFSKLNEEKKLGLATAIAGTTFPPEMLREVVEKSLKKSNCWVPNFWSTPPEKVSIGGAAFDASKKPSSYSVLIVPGGSGFDVKNLKPASDILIKKARECIQKNPSIYDVCEWTHIAYQLGAKTADLKPSIERRFKAAPKEKRAELTKCVSPHLTFPKDEALAQKLWKDTFPTRKEVFEHAKALTEIRDELPKEGLKTLDKHVAKLMKPKKDLPDACSVICKLRNSKEKWVHPKFFKKKLIGEDPSEQVFANKNLLALFDVKTRDLCKNSKPLGETFSPLPPALKYGEARTAELTRRAVLERDKVMDKVRRQHHAANLAAGVLQSAKLISEGMRKELKRKLDYSFNWKATIEGKRHISVPGKLSSSLIYALIFGHKLLNEIPKDKRPKDWAKKLLATHKLAIQNFKSNITTASHSGYTNFAVATSVLAHDKGSDLETVLESMRDTVKKIGKQCNVPYQDTKGMKGRGEEVAVYRTVTYLSALKKHARNKKEKLDYMNRIADCLERLVAHSPTGRSQQRRLLHSHIGKRFGAPYYYYGNLPEVTREALELAYDKSAPKSIRERMKRVSQDLEQSTKSEFDQKEGVFFKRQSDTYPSRPVYTNSLYGISLEPYCRMQRKREGSI